MSTAQATSTVHTSSVLPSGVREALQASSLRQRSQLVSSLQVCFIDLEFWQTTVYSCQEFNLGKCQGI